MPHSLVALVGPIGWNQLTAAMPDASPPPSDIIFAMPPPKALAQPAWHAGCQDPDGYPVPPHPSDHPSGLGLVCIIAVR